MADVHTDSAPAPGAALPRCLPTYAPPRRRTGWSAHPISRTSPAVWPRRVGD